VNPGPHRRHHHDWRPIAGISTGAFDTNPVVTQSAPPRAIPRQQVLNEARSAQPGHTRNRTPVPVIIWVV